jgi:excisionase family DNA binding protein
MTPITVSVEQVCEALGCKRRRVFQLLADGILERAPRWGRSLRIYYASLQRALLPAIPEPARKKRATAFEPAKLENLKI